MKEKGIIHEFKEFISRGSVFDMAVGIIVGTAFTSIVNSFVKDIVMPPIGYIINGVDFSALKIVLRGATETGEEVAILYGLFLQNILSFLIISFVVFFMVKFINTLKRKEEKPVEPPLPSEEILLLREIRDSLKK